MPAAPAGAVEGVAHPLELPLFAFRVRVRVRKPLSKP